MINWLSSIGSSGTSSLTRVDQLILEFNGNVEPLLNNEDFVVQIRNSAPKVLEFIKNKALILIAKFLDILNYDCSLCDDTNYTNFVLFPEKVMEIFELDVPALIQPFFEGEDLIKKAFTVIFRSTIPEPQLSNIQRLAQLLISKNPAFVSQVLFFTKAPHKQKQQPLINFFLNHIQSLNVTTIIIALFNPENQQTMIAQQEEINKLKLDFLALIVKGFDILEPLAILNVTQLIHDILTRFNIVEGSQEMMKYLISSEVLNKMFDILELNNSNKQNLSAFILLKSAGHILSLVSNYYSYSMQNIAIEDPEQEPDPYNAQLTQIFESTQFMEVFFKRSNIILNHLKTRKLTQLNLKLIEIVDNLVRISNLRLWKHLKELNLMEHLLYMFFNYPWANIMHTLIEKLILYVMNRTISDFHPFWSEIIVTELRICELLNKKLIKESKQGPYLQLSNHLNWFQKELTEKIILQGDQNKYNRQIRIIVHHFENNIDWIDCQLAQINLNKKNRLELGSGLYRAHNTHTNSYKDSDESFKDRIFQQTKTNQANIQQLAVSGDDPVAFEELQQEEEDGIEYEIKETVFDLPKEEEVIGLELSILINKDKAESSKKELTSPHSGKETPTSVEAQKGSPRTESSSSSSDSDDQADQSEGEIDKENMEHIKQERHRRSSEQLESSIKLKQLNEDQVPHEFRIVRRHSLNFDEKILIQPQNFKVLKVDEIDMSSNSNMNDSFSSTSSKGSVRKIKIQMIGEVKVLKFEEENVDLSSSQISLSGSMCSNEEKKFRKVEAKDRKFLNFLNSIK